MSFNLTYSANRHKQYSDWAAAVRNLPGVLDFDFESTEVGKIGRIEVTDINVERVKQIMRSKNGYRFITATRNSN